MHAWWAFHTDQSPSVGDVIYQKCRLHQRPALGLINVLIPSPWQIQEVTLPRYIWHTVYTCLRSILSLYYIILLTLLDLFLCFVIIPFFPQSDRIFGSMLFGGGNHNSENNNKHQNDNTCSYHRAHDYSSVFHSWERDLYWALQAIEVSNNCWTSCIEVEIKILNNHAWSGMDPFLNILKHFRCGQITWAQQFCSVCYMLWRISKAF